MLTGGCHCGAIRYEISGTAYHRTNCHCAICRRVSGAPFVTWFTVARAAFRLTAGAPGRYASSDKAIRNFCSRCGTQLTFEHAATPGEIDITTCSLDDPERLPPQDHIWSSSKLSWIALADGLPSYAAAHDAARRLDPDGE